MSKKSLTRLRKKFDVLKCIWNWETCWCRSCDVTESSVCSLPKYSIHNDIKLLAFLLGRKMMGTNVIYSIYLRLDLSQGMELLWSISKVYPLRLQAGCSDFSTAASLWPPFLSQVSLQDSSHVCAGKPERKEFFSLVSLPSSCSQISAVFYLVCFQLFQECAVKQTTGENPTFPDCAAS